MYGKRSLVRIRNQNDSTCLPRAILVGWASVSRIANKRFNSQKLPGENLIDTMFRTKTCSYYLFKSLTDGRRPAQQDKATDKLIQLASLGGVKEFDLSHIDEFERVLECKVRVISQIAYKQYVRIPPEALECEQCEGWKNVFIYHHRPDPLDILSEFHFDAITKLHAFFGYSSICVICLKRKTAETVPCCEKRCDKCLSKSCKENSVNHKPARITCASCHVRFPNDQCFSRHIKPDINGDTVCSKKWACPSCKKVFESRKRTPDNHKCGEYYCNSCETYFLQRHECYMRSVKNRKLNKNQKDRVMIFFDIETRQTTVDECKDGYRLRDDQCSSCINQNFRCLECSKCLNCKSTTCGSLLHEPNLVVCQKVCNDCSSLPFSSHSACDRCGDRCFNCSSRHKKKGIRDYNVKPCQDSETCGLREKIFFGDDCIKSFIKWLLKDCHNGSSIVSHNGSGFDNLFILNALMKETKLEPASVIFTGTRLLFMEIKSPIHLRFLDSYKFLPFPLSSLPKSFQLAEDRPGGVSTEYSKGFFPHLFNRVENETYVGPFPSKELYGYSDMNPTTSSKFCKWYEEQISKYPNHMFDFKKELIAYCQNDVAILRLACLKFRELVEQMSGIDPFAHTITLASLAMTIFRKKFLTENLEVKVSMPRLQLGRGDLGNDKDPGDDDDDDNMGDSRIRYLPGCQRGGDLKVNMGDGRGMVSVEELPESSQIKQK